MALRLSTGLRQALLGSADFKTVYSVAQINIYTGSQPPSADDAVAATLLAPITVDGGVIGLSFADPIAGVISKAPDTWAGTALATGTAGWFRLFVMVESPDGQDTTLSRMDGAIATSGGELNMSSTAIVTGAVQTITNFTVTLPSQ